jgi:hypothetical protein
MPSHFGIISVGDPAFAGPDVRLNRVRCGARMAMTFVGVLAAMAVALSVVSIFALALSAVQFPRRIRTFAGASPAEREFDQRARRWEWVGFTSLSLAVAAAMVAVFVATR